jgi:hypothetical protein
MDNDQTAHTIYSNAVRAMRVAEDEAEWMKANRERLLQDRAELGKRVLDRDAEIARLKERVRYLEHVIYLIEVAFYEANSDAYAALSMLGIAAEAVPMTVPREVAALAGEVQGA